MRILWCLALFGVCGCIRPMVVATGAVKLTDEQLKESLEPEAVLALIQSKSSTVAIPGTRSQRTIYQLEILRVIHGETPSARRVEGTHYGKPLMKDGGKYIAVLQNAPEWQPARWIPAIVEVQDDRVESEVREYTERIQKLQAAR